MRVFFVDNSTDPNAFSINSTKLCRKHLFTDSHREAAIACSSILFFPSPISEVSTQLPVNAVALPARKTHSHLVGGAVCFCSFFKNNYYTYFVRTPYTTQPRHGRALRGGKNTKSNRVICNQLYSTGAWGVSQGLVHPRKKVLRRVGEPLGISFPDSMHMKQTVLCDVARSHAFSVKSKNLAFSSAIEF